MMAVAVGDMFHFGQRVLAVSQTDENRVILHSGDDKLCLELSMTTFESLELERAGYNIVCLDCGEISQVPEDSPLGRKAAARYKVGLVDALPVCAINCPACFSRALTRAEATHRDIHLT